MTTATIVIAWLAFLAGLSGKRFLKRKATEREEQQRVRRENDESARYHLIKWAFGDTCVKNAPPVTTPTNREEVIEGLQNRDLAIRFLRALLDNPECAEPEYERFINWFDLTGGVRELRDALPIYLLGIWADSSHPCRGTGQLNLLVDNFKLTEEQALSTLDRFYDLLP